MEVFLQSDLHVALLELLAILIAEGSDDAIMSVVTVNLVAVFGVFSCF